MTAFFSMSAETTGAFPSNRTASTHTAGTNTTRHIKTISQALIPIRFAFKTTPFDNFCVAILNIR
jgi:hypothetical protein